MLSRDACHAVLVKVADELMDLEFAAAEKRRERDYMIVQARIAGISLRAIGDACMISHQTVQNICDRASALGACAVIDPTDEAASDERRAD